MATFTTLHKEEVAGNIVIVVLTFMNFLAFKEIFLHYRAEKEGWGLDLSSGLVVTSMCKLSSISASKIICSTRSYLQIVDEVILDVTGPVG
jgi:ADP-ribosylation factor 2-binding protein